MCVIYNCNHMAWITIIGALLALDAGVWASDGGDAQSIEAEDAAVSLSRRSTIVDFGEDEGLGESITVADPTPVKHDTLIPAKYRGAPPSTQPPPPRRGRGCGGCTGSVGAGGGASLGLLVLCALGVRRLSCYIK